MFAVLVSFQVLFKSGSLCKKKKGFFLLLLLYFLFNNDITYFRNKTIVEVDRGSHYPPVLSKKSVPGSFDSQSYIPLLPFVKLFKLYSQ